MNNKEIEINILLNERNKIMEEIKSSNFKGYPEVKEINGKKYIYLRYKKYDRLSSTYAGVYSDELLLNLKELSKNIRSLNTKLRVLNTKLARLGVNVDDIPANVLLNMDFIRSNINTIIYGQAIVEGVSATFMDTEEILEKGSSKNVGFDDTLTILNLKNAWKYILDEDTVRKGISFATLTTIAGYVNDRQISYPDSVRTTNVLVGGSTYRPPLPIKEEVIKDLENIQNDIKLSIVEKGINLLIYLCKTQVFSNGNKRTALIYANFFLMLNGAGFISIPSELNQEYKIKLVEFYESKNENIKKFVFDKCYMTM